MFDVLAELRFYYCYFEPLFDSCDSSWTGDAGWLSVFASSLILIGSSTLVRVISRLLKPVGPVVVARAPRITLGDFNSVPLEKVCVLEM